MSNENGCLETFFNIIFFKIKKINKLIKIKKTTMYLSIIIHIVVFLILSHLIYGLLFSFKYLSQQRIFFWTKKFQENKNYIEN